MEHGGDTHSAAFIAAYPMVRRLAMAGEVGLAEGLLDRRVATIADLGDIEQRTAALAMLDLGRAVIAHARGDDEATGVFATSAIRLRSVLGHGVETDRWLVDTACLASLGRAGDEVAALRDRVSHRLGEWRMLLLDLLADGDEEVARDGLATIPSSPFASLLPLARLTTRLPSDLTTTTALA